MIQDVKEIYNKADWQAREDYYVKAIGGLEVPIQPESRIIANFNKRLNDLCDEALLEIAYVERNYDDIDTKMKNAEKEIFCTVKEQLLQQGIKITENDVKGHTTIYLKNTLLPGMQEPVVKVELALKKRLVFMKRVINMLEKKQSALVTLNLLYKTENAVTPISNSNQVAP